MGIGTQGLPDRLPKVTVILFTVYDSAYPCLR